MTLLPESEPVPLEITVDGAVRVRGTRVTLDTIVTVFNEGATVEEIVQRYPTLALADVYAVIGFYLHRRAEVETYLRQRQEEADRVRERNEAGLDRRDIRERLLARQSQRAAVNHVATGR
jgi:uncharacterized protein (DUF433 family)